MSALAVSPRMIKHPEEMRSALARAGVPDSICRRVDYTSMARGNDGELYLHMVLGGPTITVELLMEQPAPTISWWGYLPETELVKLMLLA